tara:strand:- start:172 stop:1074 length:903 start_codon:yes stop_codon:yes gene_type:complete
MPLTVTVQKGHDFSSGNVTRAALNAGAVPTVAITGAVGTTELSDSAVINEKVATTAAIDVSKLAGQTDNNILLVGDTTGNGGKLITSAPAYGDAAIEFDSGGTQVKVTPSSDTIIAAKLLKTEDTNVVNGLAATSDDVAADDFVMIHDTSVTATDAVRLKKATISKIQKVGTTEYALVDITSTAVAGSGSNIALAIDMDGAPFQTIDLTADKDYNITITNPPTSGKLKTVTVRLKAPSGTAPRFGDTADAPDNWNTSWSWPERVGNVGPTIIGATEVALLSLTAFGPADTDVVAAYAVTQ